MLITSLREAITVLCQIRVALPCLLLTIVYLGYSHSLGRTANMKESTGAAAPGCLLQILSMLFEGLCLGAFVLALFPSLFQNFLGAKAPDLMSFALLGIRAGVLASLVLTLISLIPLLGDFLARRPGLQILLLGAAVFRMSAPLYIERSPLGALGLKLQFPGWGLSLALIACALILSEGLYGAHRVFARSPSGEALSFSRTWILPALDLWTGIIPLLGYMIAAAHSLNR